MTPRRICITGAGGFIGRHVVDVALARGLEVVAPTRAPRSERSGVHWVSASLDGMPSTVLASCDAVVHLAAAGVVTGGDDWDTCLDVNVRQSSAFLRQAIVAGVRRMVIGGSCFEYGRSAERYDFVPSDAPLEPVTAYGASKAAASMIAAGLAAAHDLEMTILRPFHVFGDGEEAQRFWPSLRAAAARSEDFPMTIGTQVRDFTPVSLVAERFIDRVFNAPAAGIARIENVGTGRPQRLEEFAREWWTRSGATGKLLVGALPMRPREVMRYVPRID
jgi:nucleoside-diphosphate-sugar epimerase